MSRPVAIDVKSLWSKVKSLPRDTLRRYKKMGPRGKAVFWFIVFMHFFMLGLVLIITPRRIGIFFNDVALRLRDMGWVGMMILSLCVVIASHPPLFGFSGSMTLIGFTYGVWPGFLIAFLASMLGSAAAFLSVRTFFLSWMRKFGSEKNDKWAAFGHVMKNKGLPLVIMIRWCPIPFAIGNGLFASIESVGFWQYMLASLLVQPRLLIPVFIGSRLTSLSDPNSRPDPLRFWLNLGSILLSVSISTATGIVIYRLTLSQMRKLDRNGTGSGTSRDGGERGEGEMAAEALEGIEEAALLGDYSGDSSDEGVLQRDRERGEVGGRGGERVALQRRRSDE